MAKSWTVGQVVSETSFGLFDKKGYLMITNPDRIFTGYTGKVKQITRTMTITGERINRFGDVVPTIEYSDWTVVA